MAFCANVDSYYNYRISLPANAVFLAIFSLSFLAFAAVYGATRKGLGFTVAMLLGVACEIIGYVGRVMSWENQWQENGFLIQIVCLTIGPAFLAAGVYLCLRRIVYAFGPENSRIPPEYYTRIFIPCDVISLVLQATGGGMASVASHNNDPVETGDNIMIAGLSFQVLTLLVFIICCIDFAVRAGTRHRRLGAAAFDQDAAALKLRGSWLFRGFLVALGLATIGIFWRSVYRVAELSRGWSGPLMYRQDLFIGFEGVMIAVACLVLNVFHPSLCFKELMDGAGGIGSKKKARKAAEVVEAREGKSEPVSDVERQSL
ncbi:RTA1-domain-containing protein [Coniochaeta ligniaria NRRL 30616]|uniref:RTA1-domain-containing protein n=1 Tax=Coniochaeta ligniaria NRRL 30616 TaxID=1408157 RepID=A0A1J7IUR4_9PEZI|nr:RTA1-domain-containing protein [Coniochaeta ligniaria NRRL 30616]